jgi:histone H3/H4
MVRRSKTELPLAPVERIMKKTTKMLISEKAAIALREIIEELAEEIALDAGDLAVYSERKTIKKRDIDMAFKQFKKR